MIRVRRGFGFISSLVMLAKAASIDFTHVPVWMTHEDLTGVVRGVPAAEHAVAVYICVGGSWWTKPSFDEPVTAIDVDLSWRCDVTTGGADTLATQYAAFLVPVAWTPYLADGVAACPTP